MLFRWARWFDKISHVNRCTAIPTDVATLHQMLDEQRQLIESLKANLHRLAQVAVRAEERSHQHRSVRLVCRRERGHRGAAAPKLPRQPATVEARARRAPTAERGARSLKDLPRVI